MCPRNTLLAMGGNSSRQNNRAQKGMAKKLKDKTWNKHFPGCFAGDIKHRQLVIFNGDILLVSYTGKGTCDLCCFIRLRKLAVFGMGGGKCSDKSRHSIISQADRTGRKLLCFSSISQFRPAACRQRPCKVVQNGRVVGIRFQTFAIVLNGFPDFPPQQVVGQFGPA